MSWNRIIGALALLALIPSWLGLLGSWHWLLDLCAHFRWQYLFGSALVIAWAAWRRQRGMILLAMLTFLLNAILIGRLAWHPDIRNTVVAEDFKLRVMSLNVQTSNQNKQAVLDHVMASDADLIFLIEVDQQWLTALATLQEKYSYRIAEPRPDNFGVALLSRIPWTKAELLWLGEARVPSVEARLTHQGREFVVIGTHPIPPMGRYNAALRDTQLQLLAEHVSQMREPVLVLGDLNATPWSTGMRIATAGNLGFRSMSPPWSPTWRVASVFAVPIDHALATAPFIITQRSVGPDVGSDHRSLNILLGWAR